MKKNVKKLRLSRETLSVLSNQDTNRAAGGWRSIIKGSCGCSLDDTCFTCDTCITCDSCPGGTC